MEKRYFKLNSYNRLRVLNEIKKMIVNDGGKILQYGKQFEIHATTLEMDEQKRKKIESLPPVKYYGYGMNWGGMELKFVFNGYFYDIDYDGNPFFPIHFKKVKVNANGEYIGKRYVDTNEEYNERQWKKDQTFVFSFGYDDFFKICDDNDILEMAEYHYQQIKDFLFKLPESEVYNDRKRVPNYYNSGYHYERIYDKTPQKIDMVFEEV